jgi:hypothetical protein
MRTGSWFIGLCLISRPSLSVCVGKPVNGAADGRLRSVTFRDLTICDQRHTLQEKEGEHRWPMATHFTVNYTLPVDFIATKFQTETDPTPTPRLGNLAKSTFSQSGKDPRAFQKSPQCLMLSFLLMVRNIVLIFLSSATWNR